MSPSLLIKSRGLYLLPLMALACDATVSGKNDVLRFRYDADDNFLPSAFSTPIGAGLSIRVEVFIDPDGSGGASQQPADVIDAASSEAAVATITSTDGNVVTIRTRAAGMTEIRVQSTRGEDRFDLRVVDVDKVDLSHPGVLVPDNPPSKGLAGGTARFIVSLKHGSEVAIGFGDIAATAEPSTAATVLTSDVVGFVPVRFEAPGSATLTGQGDEPLALDIVDQADLAGLTLAGADAVSSILPDGELATVLRGVTAAGDKVVGVASLAEVSSADTAICTITAVPKLGEGAYLIEGRSTGTCRVSATLGSLEVTHELAIEAP